MRERNWSVYIRRNLDKYSAHAVCEDKYSCDTSIGVIAASCLTHEEACEYEDLFNMVFKGGRT